MPAIKNKIVRGMFAGCSSFVVCLTALVGIGQTPPVVPQPDPIYWKQNLFLIPYQWSTAADPAAAQAVWLFVSKDQGATWHKISEAKPQVKAFNYHAEGDGEYWFAIRTVDRGGQLLPAGQSYQPELRVCVDTAMPRIDVLLAQLRSDGALEFAWRASDPNLDLASWKFEVQLDANEAWHPVPLAGMHVLPLAATGGPPPPATHDGRAAWLPPPGTRPRVLRATVYDRAGNSAASGAEISPTAINTVSSTPSHQLPAIATAASGTATPNATAPVSQSMPGWVAASDALPTAPTSNSSPQPWPASAIAAAPFRLSVGAGQANVDDVTAYGNPIGVGDPSRASADAGNDDSIPPDPVQFNYASVNGSAQAAPAIDGDQSITGPTFATLEPYREGTELNERAALKRLPAVDGSLAPPLDPAQLAGATRSQPALAELPPGLEPKRVGSRTFALEYELDDLGRAGVAKVELWGSRDGGRSWRNYATDDDNRTPLVVTVEEEGVYGFRIVVEGTGRTAPSPPCPGDKPELWVAIDLEQPVAELTSVEPGSGNAADHLVLRWRADDDNLEARPIALYYSSRPAGPWSIIATNLANTGEYAWQVQRQVPERFYLRLEARDTAGNLAAFQTREPVTLSATEPSGRLRGVEPIGPTAAGAEAGYR